MDATVRDGFLDLRPFLSAVRGGQLQGTSRLSFELDLLLWSWDAHLSGGGGKSDGFDWLRSPLDTPSLGPGVRDNLGELACGAA